VKIGLLLPTFRDSAADALAVAHDAAGAGLDGVFAYDHLWPMGSPTRPALAPFPLLATVASREPGLFVGPLVARVGLVGTDELVREFVALHVAAPRHVIGALGTGDAKSEAENAAYGLVVRSAGERRELLAEAARRLAPMMEMWIGAGAPATNELARQLGATLNLWAASAADVAAHAADGPVCWAGPSPKTSRRPSTHSPPPAPPGPSLLPAPTWPFSVAGDETISAQGSVRQWNFVASTGCPYVFAAIDGRKAAARAAGRDVVDFGFGNPDLPSPDVAVDKLAEAARNPKNHRYSASRGIPHLRLAIATRYKALRR
jgi:hypothetical protein